MRFLLTILTLSITTVFSQKDYSAYVNPMVGTGGHGHTFPGATVPFGMVQLSPDTRIDGSWDGCSGYHYGDNFIYGFSHTHLSGTGCSDYGDIALLPYLGNSSAFIKDFSFKKLGQTFKHENEKASAGYYSVKMDDNILTELTASTRCGFHRYTFPEGKTPNVLIKVTHRDKTIQSELKQVSKKRLEGFRRSEAWAKDQYIYFVIEFSSPATSLYVGGFGDDQGNNGIDYQTFTFKKLKGKPLLVRVGISNVSIEGARKNLEAEIANKEFEEVVADAKALWNKELGKIEVKEITDERSNNSEMVKVFYTALYHCFIHPSTASDVDGNYRGRDNKIHKADGFTYYSVFSIWDTYRALHPLMTIIDQKRTNDFIKTFLAQYEQGGRLPVWELSSNETDCMIGYHSVSVITDAYLKGIKNYDAELALTAMQKSAEWNHLGLPAFNKKGFLEIEDEHESVSKSLEYCYDDWCIGQFADALGKKDIAKTYFLRSKGWMNLLDKTDHFIKPRSNGGYLSPFDPREVNNNYTEANAWQYTFYVPHDIVSLMNSMGGGLKFSQQLDELFSAPTQTTGRDQADISGLIGQYAHGNEPSHHMAYLYNYVAQPFKTQKLIAKIRNEFYANRPEGLIGNEDCGQMSAWYVFSALGFYPVCPGNTQYALGTPGFEEAKIHLENGKTFTIHAENCNPANYYINTTDKFYINHEEIMQGVTKKYEMTNVPNEKNKISDVPLFPITQIEDYYVPAPVIKMQGKTFKDSTEVTIESNCDNCKAYYSFTGNEFTEYKSPIRLKESTTIYSYAIGYKNTASTQVEAYCHKIPHNYTINIKSKYNPQYTAGGDAGIIDGLLGDENWRKGGWQGYQAQDFEAVVDLISLREIKTVAASFLQDTRAWIFFPSEVQFYISEDGKTFQPFSNSFVLEKADKNQPTSITTVKVSQPLTKVRYVKIIAKNFGKLPDWHEGHGMNGDDAFIFVDEITIE